MAFFNSRVPPVGVYLVKLASIASMAACLMFCGVGKSGSPAPKSTTSLPSRRRRSASAATFMVDDALISEILSASAWVVGMVVLLLLILLRDAAPQALFNQRRHQCGDVASER